MGNRQNGIQYSVVIVSRETLARIKHPESKNQDFGILQSTRH